MNSLSSKERLALALHLTRGVRRSAKHEILKKFSDAEQIVAASLDDFLALGFTDKIFDAFREFSKTIDQTEALLKKLEQSTLGVLTITSSHYPARLKETVDAPLALFFNGDPQALLSGSTLAVVGTRQCTNYGERVLQKMLPVILERGICVVSGLAYGIDTLAHQQSVRHQALSVAVQACGVDQANLIQQRSIFNEIINSGGCVVSEFPFYSRQHMGRGLFPRRNRIVSGLSDAVLVVEAPVKSGALITARFALEQNRDVFAVPGNLEQTNSMGCLKLIQEGAKAVLSVDDILEELPGYQKGQSSLFEDQPLNLIKKIPELESDLEETLYQLCEKPRVLDEMIAHTQCDASEISALVTKLEMLGHIKQIPGKGYLSV
ncbi:MAG: DNA-protecting protein DprA [Deltaproteobacteria bacterium]|nr:DNA-protecting protein DprA [Deltaproteobacteria bacterium]